MGKLIEDGLRRCLCGHLITVKAGAGVCTHCGRTLEQVREYDRQKNHARAMDRGTMLAVNARRRERHKEISRMIAECKRIGQERGAGKPHKEVKKARPVAVAQGPDTPLNAPRRCHDCGRPTRDYRCQACRAKWRAANGLGWSTSDPAEGFAGREVEHEVAI